MVLRVLPAGDVTIKRKFGGDIYLTCREKIHSDNLLNCVLFCSVASVAVTPHKSLNNSKGSSQELRTCEDRP